MNKKTDKIVDALGSLNEDQLASCMKPHRRKALMLSGKARVALVLAAALLLTTLASALIVAPMLLGDDPIDPPVKFPGTESTEQGSTTGPELPPDVMEFPGVVQLLSLGTLSYSGIPVDENGAIREPENSNVSFDATKDWFSAPLPVINLNCGKENTVKLSCDYGSIGRVVRATEYGEEVYKYVDQTGNRYNLYYLSHFAEHEVTVKGDQSVSWNPQYQNGFIDAGLNRDTFIDYEVYNPDGEVIAAGCIYVAAFRYIETLNLQRMTKLSYKRALSDFSIHEHMAVQYTIRKAINLYGESFADEDGTIDTVKREEFYAYHNAVKAARSALPEAEWIDTSLFADEESEADYDISDLAREPWRRPGEGYRYDASIAQINLGDGFANPYDNYGEVGVGQTLEQVLATFDEKQNEYYQNFLERKAAARAEAELTFTAHEKSLIGFAKLSNDKIGLDHRKGGFTGGVSIGCNSLESEYVVFEVQGYAEDGSIKGWWMVVGDTYSSVVSEEKDFPEEGDYHYVETYTLKDGTVVTFAYSQTLGNQVWVTHP